MPSFLLDKTIPLEESIQNLDSIIVDDHLRMLLYLKELECKEKLEYPQLDIMKMNLFQSVIL